MSATLGLWLLLVLVATMGMTGWLYVDLRKAVARQEAERMLAEIRANYEALNRQVGASLRRFAEAMIPAARAAAAAIERFNEATRQAMREHQR